MAQVIKRGGKRRQAFSPSKIKNAIRKSAKDAGLSSSKIQAIVEEVSDGVIGFFKNKRVVKSTDIRRSILRRLERRSKAVASRWRAFERKKAGRI